MSFLEPVIASLLGAAVTALAVFLKKNMTAVALLKYGPLVQKAYDIIDPVLDKNLSNWDGSKVDKAFELAVESVADGELSAAEIKKLAVHMAQSWLPGAAAEKVRLLEQNGMPAEQRKAAEDITAKVNTAS